MDKPPDIDEGVRLVNAVGAKLPDQHAHDPDLLALSKLLGRVIAERENLALDLQYVRRETVALIRRSLPEDRFRQLMDGDPEELGAWFSSCVLRPNPENH